MPLHAFLVLFSPNKLYHYYYVYSKPTNVIFPRVTLLSKALALALTSIMLSLANILDMAWGLGTEDFTESLVASLDNIH